jgi:hypothetical protein
VPVEYAVLLELLVAVEVVRADGKGNIDVVAARADRNASLVALARPANNTPRYYCKHKFINECLTENYEY